jgi:hypothetical protein
MSDLSVAAAKIAKEILAGAAGKGGKVWVQIEKSTTFHVRAYSTLLVDVAAGVAAGDITKKEGKMLVENGRFLLFMGIANTTHVLLTEVQSFLNSVLSALKGAINARLPIPLL